MLFQQLFAKKSLETLHAEAKGEHRLRRILGPINLTSLGVGAIIGAGIFVMTGRSAAQDAGPAILLSFVVAGLGCLFAALAAQTRARDLLLPVLALPLWVPFVVVGGRAVQVALGGGGSLNGALALLLDFDILFVVVASLAAKFVLDD